MVYTLGQVLYIPPYTNIKHVFLVYIVFLPCHKPQHGSIEANGSLPVLQRRLSCYIDKLLRTDEMLVQLEHSKVNTACYCYEVSFSKDNYYYIKSSM